MGRIVGRAVLVTTAAAVSVLGVPTAAASPESDADDAITAAWEDAGGDGSALGAKHGDVYPVGAGFAQDFDHGKMFFTPATGARSMYGPVLDKYDALGGPAGSDLGFPTINEVPGLAGPDSRVSTFSASDKPVIFWTPDHGAFVVRAAINAAWDKLGSSGGVLGVPVADETYDGEVDTQKFSGGQVSWNRVTKAFSTTPPDLAQQLAGLEVPIDPTAAINTAWRAAGGADGPLGAKQGGQYPIGGDGIVQNFAGGKVFFSPATGANAVESDILAKYESLGGPVGSDLGFPIANEADGGIAPASRISTFAASDQPVIFWTSDHGAFVVRGAMKAAWDKLGGATGQLGAPVGDQAVDGNVVAQKFTGGKIAWDRAKNSFSTEPSKFASSLSGLQVPGQNLPAGSASAPTGNNLTWHWWWLLVVIAVLVLIGLFALAVRRRRRGRTGPDTEAYEADRELEAGYDVPVEGPSWPAEADSDLDTSRLLSDYPEPSGRPASLGAPDQRRVSWKRGAGVGAGVPEAALTGESDTAEALSDGGSGFDEAADFEEEDPDAVDTAPTRIPTAAEVSGGRHAAVETTHEDQPDASEPRGVAQLAIHLPLDDPYEVPDGYPVKANASVGLYYTPDNALYEDTLAEIWFASEEVAQANGFVKAG